MTSLSLPPSEWMERLIRIDSTTDRTNLPVVEFLLPLLKEAGLKIKMQKVREKGTAFYNLLAYNHSLDSKNLLVMNTHLDTVESGAPEQWTSTECDPWKLTQKGDRLYGLGAADVKLDFLCKLVAAKNASGTERPFVLIGTYGEERGLVGVSKLFQGGIKLRPKYALVGEPSNLELIYAHKGHIICTLSLPLEKMSGTPSKNSWRGKAAHSSTPHLGENALHKALVEISTKGWGIHSLHAGIGTNTVPDHCEAEISHRCSLRSRNIQLLFAELNKLAIEIKRSKDKRFTPDHNTLSLNLARSRGDRLELSFDIRTLPTARSNELKKKIEAIARKVGAKPCNLSIDLSLQGGKKGLFLKAAAKQLTACNIKPILNTKASSTEAAIYGSEGAEAIVFGPGVSIGNVHRPNEHNLLSHLEIATRFYTRMLQAPLREY